MNMATRVFIAVGLILVAALALWMSFRSPGAEFVVDAAPPTASRGHVDSPGAQAEAGPMRKGQADGEPQAAAAATPQPRAVEPGAERVPAPAAACPCAGTTRTAPWRATSCWSRDVRGMIPWRTATSARFASP